MVVVVDENFESQVGKDGSNLLWVDRIQFSNLSEIIIDEYIDKGIPLVVENCTAGMIEYYYNLIFNLLIIANYKIIKLSY